MLGAAVAQLNTGPVEAVRLVVGCNRRAVLAAGVVVAFIQQHRDQMALPIQVAVAVAEVINLWHLALVALAL